MSNLDTKALRALEAEAGRDGWASSSWGAFRDALERAAPALLDAAEERDRLRAKIAEWHDEVRRFNAGHDRHAESYFKLEDEFEQRQQPEVQS